MPIFAKRPEGSGDFDKGSRLDRIPEGDYSAICNQIIDLGQQPGYDEGTTTHQIWIGFYLFGPETDIGSFYTVSLFEGSKMYQHCSVWRGGFTKEELGSWDVTELLGKPARVDVVHKKTYPAVGAILAPRDIDRKKAQQYKGALLLYDDSVAKTKKGDEVLGQLPPFLVKRIRPEADTAGGPKIRDHEASANIPVHEIVSEIEAADGDQKSFPF